MNLGISKSELLSVLKTKEKAFMAASLKLLIEYLQKNPQADLLLALLEELRDESEDILRTFLERGMGETSDAATPLVLEAFALLFLTNVKNSFVPWFLREHSKLLYRCLSSNNAVLIQPSLRVLLSIAVSGKFGCELLREEFDFSLSPLPVIITRGRKEFLLFLQFTQNILENASLSVIEHFVSFRPLMISLFQGFRKFDLVRELTAFLSLCERVIVENEKRSINLVLQVFNTSTLKMLLDTNENFSAFFSKLMTKPGHGICYPASPTDTLKNKVILDFLGMLQPWQVEWQLKLCLKIAIAAPDTVRPYLQQLHCDNWEPEESAPWASKAAFLIRLLKEDDLDPGLLRYALPSRTLCTKTLLKATGLIIRFYLSCLISAALSLVTERVKQAEAKRYYYIPDLSYFPDAQVVGTFFSGCLQATLEDPSEGNLIVLNAATQIIEEYGFLNPAIRRHLPTAEKCLELSKDPKFQQIALRILSAVLDTVDPQSTRTYDVIQSKELLRKILVPIYGMEKSWLLSKQLSGKSIDWDNLLSGSIQVELSTEEHQKEEVQGPSVKWEAIFDYDSLLHHTSPLIYASLQSTEFNCLQLPQASSASEKNVERIIEEYGIASVVTVATLDKLQNLTDDTFAGFVRQFTDSGAFSLCVWISGLKRDSDIGKAALYILSKIYETATSTNENGKHPLRQWAQIQLGLDWFRRRFSALSVIDASLLAYALPIILYQAQHPLYPILTNFLLNDLPREFSKSKRLLVDELMLAGGGWEVYKLEQLTQVLKFAMKVGRHCTEDDSFQMAQESILSMRPLLPSISALSSK